MRALAAYVTFLIVFGICDAVWLGTMASRLYRPALGNLLLETPRYAPAIIFYLGLPMAVLYFATFPGVRAESGNLALVDGALIGLLAFATYSLTNLATLRAWTPTLAIADIAYGTVAIGFCSWATYLIVRRLVDMGWI